MKKQFFLFYILILTCALQSHAQYVFNGTIEEDKWNGEAYLSLVEDYRKTTGVYAEQVIAKSEIENNAFYFEGNNLDLKNKIYRIHVDNCKDDNENHFNGYCEDSQEILFIANNLDTISLPISKENQMFCSIESSNVKSTVFFQIDSLKEQMSYDYGAYRSETNKKLNNKKWFKKLQDFGVQLNEPLAEIYIYSFLSDRSGELYSYYLEDLKSNDYYDNLLERLKQSYPNSSYLKQYETELKSDVYVNESAQLTTGEHNRSIPWISILLGVSLMLNAWYLFGLWQRKKKRKENAIDQLTKQEQKILDLILQDKSNKEIANEIFVSVSTVKTHINNLYKKLNLQTRDQVKQHFSAGKY